MKLESGDIMLTRYNGKIIPYIISWHYERKWQVYCLTCMTCHGYLETKEDLINMVKSYYKPFKVVKWNELSNVIEKEFVGLDKYIEGRTIQRCKRNTFSV